jgi:hypothetical protein
MKQLPHYLLYLLIALGLTVPATTGLAQSDSSARVNKPFDSLTISNVEATGKASAHTLVITMQVTNSYSKVARVHFSLGGFEGLGITDNKGSKYKIHTYDGLTGTEGINKGYLKIGGVEFADVTFHSFTYVEKDLAPGQSAALKITIPKFAKDISVLPDVHIRCILSVNYLRKGDDLFQVNNLNVKWEK